MAMAALRLRRHLLAGPTRSLPTRIGTHIHRSRTAAAAASALSPRPTPSADSISAHRPPSPFLTLFDSDSHRSPSPRPIRSAPFSGSFHRLPQPRSTPRSSAIDGRCLPDSTEERCHQGVLTAAEASPLVLLKATAQSMGVRAARRILSSAPSMGVGVQAALSVAPSWSLFGAQKRPFSHLAGLPEVTPQSRLPPVRQLAFCDDSQVSKEEWVDPIAYFKKYPLLVDARTNPLNLEIPDFANEPRYNFSEDTGVPLFKCLTFLALVNNNRGYCIKRSFRMDNLLLCPRLNQFMFNNVEWDYIDCESSEMNRASSYLAAATLMRKLFEASFGPDVVSQLLEEPRDLFSKMERPSDERLIIYHPSFLLTDGKIWMYEKLYRFFFKVIPFSKNGNLKNAASEALRDMAYTSEGKNVSVVIEGHPLLSQIDSNAPIGTEASSAATTARPSEVSDVSVAESEKSQEKMRRFMLGKKVVALPRHTIKHAFDTNSRNTESKFSTEDSPKKLWPYSLEQVVDLLKSIIPLHLLKTEEIFIRLNLWTHLQMDSFWARDLTWMGGVPPPTEKEAAAIKKALSYGKRRQQSKKLTNLTEVKTMALLA
uniref:Uncharacterized protein n=1 Tax=Oryza punctata TaxID=4537 RepID=A0A0E0KJP7_ORYPU